MIFVPIILGRDRVAHLRLPADLTQVEGEKLARVVLAYVDHDGALSKPRPSWEAYAAALGAIQ